MGFHRFAVEGRDQFRSGLPSFFYFHVVATNFARTQFRSACRDPVVFPPSSAGFWMQLPLSNRCNNFSGRNRGCKRTKLWRKVPEITQDKWSGGNSARVANGAKHVVATPATLGYFRRRTLLRMSGQNSLAMLLSAADSIWVP